ncbi:MAG: OB-fold nucleic acid binding domain-containing protein [Candidatus Diapherotrites archaeon]
MEFDDAFISRIALAVSLAGLCGLIFLSLSEEKEFKKIELSEVPLLHEGSKVEVQAFVAGFSVSERNLFVVLEDGATKLNAVKFNFSSSDLEFLEEGKMVSVKGIARDYKGEKELVVQNFFGG